MSKMDLTPAEIMKQQNQRFRKLYGYIFNEKIILEGLRGSISHNLVMDPDKEGKFGTSDIDTFSIMYFPLEYYLSMESYYHAKEVVDKKTGLDDMVKFSIHKAFHLLSGCNPNVISFLWNKPEHYTYTSEGGKLLLENRQIFLSRRRIKAAFLGYSWQQLNKLQNGSYKGYMGDKRKKIVDEYGFDLKNAQTLIMLLRQGVEFLETGDVQTYRENDRDFFVDIRKGKYDLDEIKDFADVEFKKLDEAYEKSEIPLENNKTKINELLVEIMKLELKL